MLCQSCAFENPKDSRFCRRCGIAIQSQTASPSQEKFTYDPPDPYSWKEDDVNDVDDRGVRQRSAPPETLPPPIRVGVPQRNGDVHVTGILAPQHQGIMCPQCGGQMALSPVKKVSSSGWIVFVILLIFFFPLAWVGLLIKKNVYFCLSCNTIIEAN
jgi:hypothetical protein